MQTRVVVLVGAVAVACGLGAGCSDDGDRTSDAPAASVEAWCDAFDDTASSTEAPEDNVAFDLLVDVAPGEIREASEVLRDYSLGETSGDVTAADAEVRAYAGEHCS